MFQGCHPFCGWTPPALSTKKTPSLSAELYVSLNLVETPSGDQWSTKILQEDVPYTTGCLGISCPPVVIAGFLTYQHDQTFNNFL